MVSGSEDHPVQAGRTQRVGGIRLWREWVGVWGQHVWPEG